MIYSSSSKRKQTLTFLRTILLLVVSVTACGNNKDIIEEESYIKLIAEFQVNKAYLQVTKDSLGYRVMKDSIYINYGIDPETFAASHAYYEKDIEEQIERYKKSKEYLSFIEKKSLLLKQSISKSDSLTSKSSNFSN